jgi:signal peptidase I
MNDNDKHSTTKVAKKLPKTKVAESPEASPGFVSSFFGFDNLKSLAILVLVIFAFRWSVVSPYHVPTASMEPTIKVGDRLLALKLAYDFKIPFTDIALAKWAEPKRGDIIVFRYPEDPDIDYVKRVVGIAGDKLQIKNDILYINGEAQPRESHDFDRTILDDIEDTADIKMLYREKLADVDHWVMQNKPGQRHFTGSDWPANGEPYTVPKESVFVMGDNRDNSTDSRKWFEVPRSYIRGKAMFVIWSLFTAPGADWPKMRYNRFGHVLH